MRGPINTIDYERFLALAEQIRQSGDSKNEINIYMSTDASYVHIELAGHGLHRQPILNILETVPPSAVLVTPLKRFVNYLKDLFRRSR